MKKLGNQCQINLLLVLAWSAHAMQTWGMTKISQITQPGHCETGFMLEIINHSGFCLSAVFQCHGTRAGWWGGKMRAVKHRLMWSYNSSTAQQLTFAQLMNKEHFFLMQGHTILKRPDRHSWAMGDVFLGTCFSLLEGYRDWACKVHNISSIIYYASTYVPI